MKLYHPSNRKFKIVKVKYFGDNCYTQRDLKTSKVKRSFWYLTPEIPEHRFKRSPYIYEIKVSKGSIYDLRSDREGLIAKYEDIDRVLKDLKRRYLGVRYNVDICDIIAIFKDMKPIKITERI